jgi:hypothetical protein
MSPAARIVSTLLVLTAVPGLGLGLGGAVAAADASPAITVTVDQRTVADGDTRLIETDPTVGVTVDADRSIRVVSVRLNGTTERRFTPNGTDFETSVDLDVASGHHALDVVVKTGDVVTHSTTVIKDAERPYVQYTSPFETEPYAPPPATVTVNRSRIVLGGTFTDVAGVEHLRIVRTTEYEVDPQTRTDRDVYAAGDLNGSFAQPIFLAAGANNVSTWYYDRLGHVRRHELRIVVDDTAPPSLSNLSAVRPSTSTLRIRGEATDNGQIRSVSVHPVEQSGRTYLLSPGTGAADPERQRVVFERDVSLSPGATAVVVNATDTAGNSVERTVTVRRSVAPQVGLDPSRTRFGDGGEVVVAGRATDGEVVAATVEAVDPATGEVVDLASVHDGGVVTDLDVEERLDPSDGRTVTVRLRVIDAAGTEHVVSRTLTRPVETTPASTATPARTTPPARTATPGTPTTTPTSGPPRLTLPVVGATVAIPAPLAASVAVPIPVVGPFDLPIVPFLTLVVIGVVVVRRR